MQLRSLEPVFCEHAPSNQTAVDILKGAWVSALPDECHVAAGQHRHFDFEVDPRVKWVDGLLPAGLRDLSVLELGPFEAYNTWQFERLGARRVVAVEASDLNYIKCLIVKEITGIRASFLHGDFMKYLEQEGERFDVVWASGVLYHQTEPLRFLDLATRAARRIFIMTHYFDSTVIGASEHLSRFMVPERDTTEMVGGHTVALHYRSYKQAKGGLFSGGLTDHSYWLEKPDIMNFLTAKGFDRIRVHVDHPHNPSGPAISLFAEKLGP